jgi:hypothetical protein
LVKVSNTKLTTKSVTYADGLEQACHCHYGYIDELHAKDVQYNKPLPSEAVIMCCQRVDLTWDRHCYNPQASQVGSTFQRMRRMDDGGKIRISPRKELDITSPTTNST